MKLKQYWKSRKSYLKLHTCIFPRVSPSFYIIGTQKGGTSSLYQYIIQHPDILPASHKEMRFFDKFYDYGIDWYRYHFERYEREKVTGEASPEYLYNIQTPIRIKKHFPNSKLIVLLRNPVDRAYSNYNMIRSWGKEKLSFSEAIDKEEERVRDDKQKLESGVSLRYLDNLMNYSYVDRGFYSKQIRLWFKYFPKEQFLFLKSEDFFSNPKKITLQVVGFLGLDNRDSVFKHVPFKVHNGGTYEDTISHSVREKLTEIYASEESDLKKLTGLEFNWFKESVKE